jgi:hypothetical protein
MKTVRFLLITLFALNVPSSALAMVPDVFREFVTYGGFNATVNAFERLALLMSDASFHTFTISCILLSGLIWGAQGFFTMIRSGNPAHWLQGIVIILIGAAVYLFFIVPRSDLIVYDEPSNRHMVIAEVPDGLILLAGLHNQFVQGAVDMLWISGDPESYRQNAQGDIFNILQNVFKNIGFVPSLDDSSGKNLSNSLQRYFKDCVLFELSRPGSTLDPNDFFANTDVLDILARSVNPAKPTIYYDTANPSGRQCSCTESYNQIVYMLGAMSENAGTNYKFWEERCEKSGYFDYMGVDGMPAQEVCRNKVVDFLSVYLTPQTSLNLMRQFLVSNQIYTYIKQNHADLLTDFKIMTSLRGEAEASIKWLPMMKAAVFTVYIGLTPFLFMLLPTLVFNRVLQFILGIFVFMTAWEICDALLHSYAMDFSIASMREILNNGLSLKTLWMMEGESQNAMVIFGKMRWASMILASTLSVVLARFGGLAMAHVAGMLNVGGYGAAASQEVREPTQRADKLQRLPNTMPTEAITNEYGYNAMAARSYYNQATGMIGDTITMARLGGPGAAAERIGQTNAHDTMRGEQRMLADRDTAAQNGNTAQDSLYERSRSSATRDAGRAAADSSDWSRTGHASHQAALDERASYLHNRAIDDIKRTGEVSDYVRGGMETLSQANGGEMSLTKNTAVNTNLSTDQERENLKRWLNDKGYEVDKIGSNVQMDLGMNADGELIPTGVRSFEGHSGRGGYTFSEVYGHKMDMGITPDRPLIVKQNDQDLTFVGGRLTGFEGGYHEIQGGVTRDGQLINGRIGQDGELIQTTHPSALQVSSSSMQNLLSKGTLPNSHMNVKDNPGAAVDAFVGAVRTFASHEQISSRAYAEGFDIHLGGNWLIAGGKAGINKSQGETTQAMENQVANNIREKIESAKTNQEALDIMQREYRDVINNMVDAEPYSTARPELIKDNLSEGLQKTLEDRLSQLEAKKGG